MPTLQLDVTIQEGAAIFNLLTEMRTQPSTPPELQSESAPPAFDPSHYPGKPLGFYGSTQGISLSNSLNPAPQAKVSDYSAAVRQLHRLLVNAKSNGFPGQLNMMKYWAECHGQAPLKELDEHCGHSGAKDFHAFACVSGSITKKLNRLLGSTMTLARGRRPTLPEAWHGCVADLPKEEGSYTYYMAEELIQPLRQAFGLE
jgi:hypothetical protein